ncbi:MAG: hypothetical protein ACRDH9_05565 [Actinomycetota bacterium]
MKDALILATLVVVGLVAAGLSLLAWHKLSRGPAQGKEKERPRLDSEDPGV